VIKLIRVLVVDDSIFMRNIISDMLGEEKDIEVVGAARNGKQAIELNEKLKPDVITLDIEMPIMNGLEALKKIMAKNPTRVIMLSSLTEEGAKETLEALENGAYDFLQKPSGQISLDIRILKEELIEKIRDSKKANIKLLKKQSTKKVKINLHKFVKNKINKNTEQTKKYKGDTERIVVIGISTGGPNALQRIIPNIPQNINAGLLIVQHMPPKFTKSLADRLDTLSNINVREARDGDEIENGLALIAPGNYHMIVKKQGNKKIVKLNQDPPYTGHRPSANITFKSVSEVYKEKTIGVIMTGMGGDGAEYLKEIKNQGGETIGQSERTCVIYGMPRVAYEMGGVNHVVDLEEIPNKIMELLKS